MKYIIDAQGKKLGRVASEAATLLRGKNRPSFSPNVLPHETVEIINASKLAQSPRKAAGTFYTRYSGYPGGFRRETRKEAVERRGNAELLRKTILGMLPRNYLRARIIRHLTVRN